MLCSMHICASPKPLSTTTTTFIPPQPSTPRFPSPLSSTPIAVIRRTPFSYHSDHRTPSIHVPISDVRDDEKEHERTNDNTEMADDSCPKPETTTTTTTRPTTQAHDPTSTATPQLDAYALPPPDTYSRIVFKMSNIDYINEDTTDSESISDVGQHHLLIPPPPRIYFPESLITYIPPYSSDLITRDPDVKGVPRNYRSWARAGRPRLELEGATRSDAKSDFISMGLVWHGSGNGDGESDSDMSDGKGDDKDKRRRKKKKLTARRNAPPTLLMDRPKRTVRRIAEADGQLRIVPGFGNTTSTTSGGHLDKPDRFDSSRAQSLARSSLPSSRAPSPSKRLKASDRGAGAERKTEAGAEAEDEEKDADGSEEEDVDADGEVDPDAIVLENEKQRPSTGVVVQQQQGSGQSGAKMTMRMEVPTANKALSESSSVTLIDTDGDKEKSKNDVDMLHADRATRQPRHKRKRDDDDKEVDNANSAPSPSKKPRARRRTEIRRTEPKRNNTLIENPSRKTRSTVPATQRTKRKPNRRSGASAVKSESAVSERISVPSVTTDVSDQEMEGDDDDKDSELEDDQDGTFTLGRQNNNSRIKQSRIPRTRSKPSIKAISTNAESTTSQQAASSRPARGTRAKRKESSPPPGFFDLTNSDGSEAKDNAGSSGVVTISRPHHRTVQPSQPPLPIPTRTFEPDIAFIEGYSGFYRRYPLILQFDTTATTEIDTPPKKTSTFGDMETYILDGIPSDLIPNPKRPLGNFNPPRDIRDLYTPRYTKGSGGKKLALCPICFEDPRRGGEGRQEWNHTKTSQHNYHMQYYHGISATRFQPFSPPLCHRVVPVPRPQSNEKSEILQGKCHHCKQWIALEGCKVGELKVKELFWWKHAAGCHKDSKFTGESDIFIEDEAYKRLLKYEAEHGIEAEATTT